MTTPMTFTPQRSAVAKPIDTDVVNIDEVAAALQGIGDRTEWVAKLFADVKHAKTTASDNDFSNTSFADAPSLAALTFTDVKVGDIIVLHASMNLAISDFTPDGTDPTVSARFYLAGATDITVADSGYPKLRWGSTIASGIEDGRLLAFSNVHVVTADAASLAAKLQVKVANIATVFNDYASIVGLHLRLGAT